jgi:Ala-tRNA(Pro) deacylase
MRICEENEDTGSQSVRRAVGSYFRRDFVSLAKAPIVFPCDRSQSALFRERQLRMPLAAQRHAEVKVAKVAYVCKETTGISQSQNLAYMTIPHTVANTAKQIAAITHISNKELAKTVIIKVDGVLAMAVLPATYDINLIALRAATNAKNVTLAKESEFKNRFPECDIGAMPPFGNLYGMTVYVDESLSKDKDIAFNAGAHDELLHVSYADFARLVKPTISNFAELPDSKSVGAWHL